MSFILVRVFQFYRRGLGDFFVGCLFITELSVAFVGISKIIVQVLDSLIGAALGSLLTQTTPISHSGGPGEHQAAQNQQHLSSDHVRHVPDLDLPLHVLEVRTGFWHSAAQSALPPALAL